MWQSIGQATFLIILTFVLIIVIEKVNIQAADNVSTQPLTYLTFLNVPESHSKDIQPFYKWTSALGRMDAQTQPPQPWKTHANALSGLGPRDMAQEVDNIVDQYSYVSDMILWGISDYWAAPAEFFARGGDCEDFVIAKYAWLRSLGVAEERLRIAVVHDRVRNRPHAVLILYLNNKAVILDSQVRDIRDSDGTGRYRLLYSINRLGWWYPDDPENIHTSLGDNMKLATSCLQKNLLPECINTIAPAAQ